jgi:hypothetical protein
MSSGSLGRGTGHLMRLGKNSTHCGQGMLARWHLANMLACCCSTAFGCMTCGWECSEELHARDYRAATN